MKYAILPLALTLSFSIFADTLESKSNEKQSVEEQNQMIITKGIASLATFVWSKRALSDNFRTDKETRKKAMQAIVYIAERGDISKDLVKRIKELEREIRNNNRKISDSKLDLDKIRETEVRNEVYGESTDGNQRILKQNNIAVNESRNEVIQRKISKLKKELLGHVQNNILKVNPLDRKYLLREKPSVKLRMLHTLSIIGIFEMMTEVAYNVNRREDISWIPTKDLTYDLGMLSFQAAHCLIYNEKHPSIDELRAQTGRLVQKATDLMCEASQEVDLADAYNDIENEIEINNQ